MLDLLCSRKTIYDNIIFIDTDYLSTLFLQTCIWLKKNRIHYLYVKVRTPILPWSFETKGFVNYTGVFGTRIIKQVQPQTLRVFLI